MVENRITDGKRIAQFLASELTGLETGSLARVSVVDAVPDAEPTSEGTDAYRIAFDEAPVASVVIYPERADVLFSDGLTWRGEASGDVQIEGSILTIESVAAVKRAVDCLRATLASEFG